jgi:glycosyltransferase involved in cell wall biosynthesis
MKLSVILPCFNGAATIAVQLEALTRQHWPGGWEVVVVDNGSTDHSMAIVERYRDRLPGLRIVPAHKPGTPRLGVPHSYNTGIQAATGEAFVFCEADDEVAPGWLDAMGRALQLHEFVLARLDHRKLNPPGLHPLTGDGFQANGLYRHPEPPHYFSGSAAGFGLRRSLYEAIGPLSVDYPIAHDDEYCCRAQAAGYSLHFEPEALVHYRERSTLGDRYRQGRGWGRDTTRMLMVRGWTPGRHPVPRQLLWLARCLPEGAGALLARGLRMPSGQRRLADWVWNFGWSVGKLQALAKANTGSQQKREGPPAGPLTGTGLHKSP